MKLSEIKRLLGELSIEPSKSLGQNFLHDQNLARWMVSVLEPSPADHFVELGPGLGALTEYLVEFENRLTVVEKDGRLAALLTARLGDRIQVMHADAARIDLRELYGWGPVKVIGNLPYYMTSPILALFLGKLSPAMRLIFTVQKELAHRLVAVPRTKDYGAMTVCIQRRWKIHILRTLPPTVFYPQPKVDSAVILITPRESAEILPCNEVLFEKLVRRGFSERRKQLRKLLGDTGGVWEKFAEAKGLSPLVRAEELSVRDYAELTSQLDPSHFQKPQSAEETFDVVDSHDQIVRQASRSEVHSKNLLHRAVHILIQNKAGEWFLQKRSIGKDQNAGKWDSSAAGHLEAGEDYETAARRELLEELGIHCEVRGAGRLQPSITTHWEFIEIFYARHEGPFSLAPLELDAGAFFKEETIRRWIQKEPEAFSPVFLKCFECLSRDAISL